MGHVASLASSSCWKSVDFLLSFAVIALLLAMIFKLLPDARIAWSDVWIGAAIASLLFTIGKVLIGLYLGGPLLPQRTGQCHPLL